jgi:hypothetical protein
MPKQKLPPMPKQQKTLLLLLPSNLSVSSSNRKGIPILLGVPFFYNLAVLRAGSIKGTLQGASATTASASNGLSVNRW